MVFLSSLRWHIIISTPTCDSVIKYSTALKYFFAFDKLHPIDGLF